jgi:hypothetical protein
MLGGTSGWDNHLSRYVHKQVFNNPITSLQARAIRNLMRYAVCRMTNLRQINESGNRFPEAMNILDERLKGVKMKILNEWQLQTQVPIAAWLLLVTNGLLAVTYLLIIALTLGAPAYLLMRALAFPALMVALAIPGLIAGFGLRERKAWARILGFVGVLLQMAALIVAFLQNDLTLGTLIVCAVLGTYVIFVLMQSAVSSYLSAPRRPLETAPRHA